MPGAIVGDIVGSVCEFDNHRSRDFRLFRDDSHFADDTILGIATANTLMQHEHPDGIKGAQATAMVIYWARMGVPRNRIRRDLEEKCSATTPRPRSKSVRRTMNTKWIFYDPNLSSTDPNKEITGKVYFESNA